MNRATDTSIAERRARLKNVIENDVFVKSGTRRVVIYGMATESWVFDFRAVLLKPQVLADLAYIFWNRFHDRTTFQIGGMEVAAIPLITALVYAGHHEFGKNVSGFFIRKSRKKDGLLKALEGEFRPDVPVILVDDVANTGASLMKQVEIIEKLGGRVESVWTIMHYRDTAYYKYFSKKGISVEALFSLDDFSETLGEIDLQDIPSRAETPFSILWHFASEKPALEHVNPKSDPAIDDARVYVGSDIGTLWALDQKDGSVVWSFKTGPHVEKGIFSSPALARGNVFFGSYDGNVYALDAKTGKPIWISPQADWIGSSPCIAEDLGLVFIGLELGLWRRRGGIVALDIKTGRRKWVYAKMPNFTHSTPLYIQDHSQVVIGSNDGAAYLFDAASGTLIWKFETGTPSEQELNSGFSAHDIKESFAYDSRRDLVIFGNLNKYVFFVDRKSGHAVNIFEAEYGFFSSPVIYKDTVLIASLDKHLYCIHLDTFKEKWRWNAGARMFATPIVIENSIYVGSNTGMMVELDPETGRERAFLQLTERITNTVAYNSVTKRFFIPTQANEIYCVEKTKQKKADPE